MPAPPAPLKGGIAARVRTTPFFWPLLTAFMATVVVLSVALSLSALPGRGAAFSDSLRFPPVDSAALMRRWESFVSCLHETPCSAHAQIPRNPPSYATAEAHFLELYAASAHLRGLSAHSYGGFSGPWIENLYIQAAEANASAFFAQFYPVVPLLLQQTDICVDHGAKRDGLNDFLKQLRPEFIYSIVTQHDNGLCFLHRNGEPFFLDPCTTLPPNLLHFSGGGYGNIPIPLIMGDVRAKAPGPRPEASHAVIFSGSLDTHAGGHRRAMAARLQNLSAEWGFSGDAFYRFHFGEGWEEALARTALVTSPRGWGRSSFRASELVQMGLAQLFVWDDTPWLPYWHPDPKRRQGRQEFWGREGIGLALNVSGLSSLREILCDMLTPDGGASPCLPPSPSSATGAPPEPFLRTPFAVGANTPLGRMRARAAAFAGSHFTYAGVQARIAEFLATPWDADLVCRPYPKSRNNF